MNAPAADDLFFSLTPQKVLEAVEVAGVPCNPVCYPLNSFENRVYEVEREDRTRVVAKFYRPGRWTEAQLLEEHQFLQELAEEELPVCAPRAFPEGGTLRQIEGIYYCLFDRMGGRAPDELDDGLLERLGMLVARMHNVGAARPGVHRVRVDANTFVRQELAWMEGRGVLPPGIAGRYAGAARRIADLADARMRDVEVHRLHGDLHLGNLLLRDGVLRVLDFDDMAVGPAMQDLWLIAPGRDAEAMQQRAVLVEGYEKMRSFSWGELRLVEPLRGMRMVRYAAWLARRWHDPIFPRTWPHFGTPSYWNDETRALEEILEVSTEN
ncbi:serine/threonine protein kinase [Chondromyces apiculatus]|uniref:Stress response kinase A n=1 Tax=Chondromyces apiculatus DSM 436 TaxID=1192034 RepID=A0A017T5J4_9BACT|nr:serine/threonine protein kinase [Chondromyces apiculatus]EYF04504.1 YihE protein, required for LPS synthesis [Chondromyces apiculatus DSM 436]